MKTLRNPLGFALIELMVIVAVLSLAASFFVPRFLKHRIRISQEECSKNLLKIYEAETAYREGKGAYAGDVKALDWTPQGIRYEYRVIRAGKSGFTAECTGNIDRDPTLDRASIDETGKLTQIEDDAAR
ncbi:MAG TPA: type II secretion system protein [bacterium]|nr:type II secretion system protein [bacterium]